MRYFIEKNTNQVKAYELSKDARELSSKEIELLKNSPSNFHEFTFDGKWILTEAKALEKELFEKDERKFEVSERIKVVNEELMMLKMNPIPDDADIAKIEALTAEQLELYQELKELNRDPNDFVEEEQEEFDDFLEELETEGETQ